MHSMPPRPGLTYGDCLSARLAGWEAITNSRNPTDVFLPLALVNFLVHTPPSGLHTTTL